MVGLVGWMLINPDLLADRASLGFAGTYAALATAVFVWPLWGVHKRIELEKERALHEINLRFETLFSEFNQLLQDKDYVATERLSRTISSLEIQHKQVSDIPTWPWRPETARIVLTAIALPLTLMIFQSFVLQALVR